MTSRDVDTSTADSEPLGRPRCWLSRRSGARILVRDRGLMLGRGQDCDVILDDRRASVNHALVTPTLRGLEVVHLGRNPTRVGGEAIQGRAVLRDGDVLEVPGACFDVAVEPGVGWSRETWVVDHPDGTAYSIRQLPFSVGGGVNDHLQVVGWPPKALEFHVAQGTLAVEVGAPAVMDGDELPAGAVEAIEDGDEIEINRAPLKIRSVALAGRDPTVMMAGAKLPTRAIFEFMPNGGRLELHFITETPVRVELSELRARLVAALLSPPGDWGPGEHVPDENLIPAIWPGSRRTRTDLNLLIHRTRKDLLRAGLNPSVILARAKKGGSTCFRLTPGAKVSVQ